MKDERLATQENHARLRLSAAIEIYDFPENRSRIFQPRGNWDTRPNREEKESRRLQLFNSSLDDIIMRGARTE
jgi:hypothetical protein